MRRRTEDEKVDMVAFRMAPDRKKQTGVESIWIIDKLTRGGEWETSCGTPEADGSVLPSKPRRNAKTNLSWRGASAVGEVKGVRCLLCDE